MAIAKVSLSIEREVLSLARKQVGPRGLSHYVSEALRRQLQHDGVAGLLVDLDREFGPVDPAVMEEVREEWPATVGRRRRRPRA